MIFLPKFPEYLRLQASVTRLSLEVGNYIENSFEGVNNEFEFGHVTMKPLHVTQRDAEDSDIQRGGRNEFSQVGLNSFH